MKRLFFILISIMLLFHFAVPSAAETFPMPNLSTLMQDVKSAIRQAEARYESGNVSGAADLARKILAKYPDNADAQAILDKCIATEKADYETSINSLDVDCLSAFLQKYPASSYKSDIERYIDDVPLWNIARKENSVDSYNKYLLASSHLLFKQDADDAIQEITVKQAFDAAVATNTIKGYENFRSSYPDSKYDKDASNKIARLLADKFTSKSTYADKNNALAYAKNEMTRDYVNNKFNKATATSSRTYSSTTTSSSSRSSNNTSYSGTSSSQPSLNSGNSEKSIRFGLSMLVDFGMYSNYSGDLWYDSYPYSLGLAALVRFGDQRKPINFIMGIKAIMSNANTKYTSWESYHSYDYTDKSRINEIVLPFELNWNFLSSDFIGMYLGIGYQLGTTSSQAFKFSFGVPWTHGDWNVYYIKYIKGPFYGEDVFSPFVGMSYTYYF